MGPRSLSETQAMPAGLKQAVLNGQISMEQIDCSVQLLLELKLHYSILTQEKALQFAPLS